ncbi:MAG: FAD-dependent oxidoreductase [Chloroflexi bacterium]|nr:FAD-dependent oxidoreductase [Chloroflexota bacterium]
MAQPKLKKLFEPIRIGNVEVRNRIKIPPFAIGYAENGFVTPRLKNFYEARSEGGAGLIGIASTAARVAEFSPLTGFWDEKFIPGLKELSAAVHKHGAKIFPQFGVGYGWSFGPYDDVVIPSPSGVSPTAGRQELAFRLGAPSRQVPRIACTKDQIHGIIEGYGSSAKIAREAGFDMVEVMLGAGYMLCHWLSPLTNKRTDEYGGSLENRLRIATEIIANIKKKAGDDFPVITKIATSDLVFEAGYNLEDAQEMAKILEKAGYAAFDQVPAWHESTHPAMNWYAPDGAWVHLAEAIKKVVKVPVATGMRIPDPFIAEQALADGRADIIVWGRPFIAEQNLANLVKEAKYEDIRECIVCSKCVEMVDTPVGCSVNPAAGKEAPYAIKPAAAPRKVLVVGGGAAGLEAATVAARRGHDVTLWEGSDKLGGLLNQAIVPMHKDHLAGFMRYQITQVKKAGVKIEINKKADASDVVNFKADAVIVATGSKPIIPDIPGIKWPSVVHALDVLSGKKHPSGNIVIIGGGMVGCETAETLGHQGKKVTVLEMLPRLALDVGRLTRWNLLLDMKKFGVRSEAGVNVKEITFLGVRGIQNGKSVFFDADTVIIATGMKADDALSKALQGKVANLQVVGDCVKPRRLIDITDEGYRAGLAV